MGLKVLVGAAELGLVYGVMALGVYITYRILDFPDMTVDGSITLGAAVTAVIIGKGYSPWLGVILSPIAGALAGLCTGILHTGLKIQPLLAGILTMTGLYSVNLRVMGRANLSLLGTDTLITGLEGKVPGYLGWTMAGMLLAALVTTFVCRFFGSELGLALRATGANETMAKSQGVNVDAMKILGLSLGNALVALSGAVVAQLQGYADMGMGVGTIVAGLAAVIIGETLIDTTTIPKAAGAVITGSLIYRTVISVALRMGLKTTDLKLVTAVLVVLALSSSGLKKVKLLGRWSHASAQESNENI